MGPGAYKPGSPDELNRCSERTSNDCDPTETDGCCAVIPCTLCVQFDADSISYATAEFTEDGWYATIAGASFRGYWERNYETGDCEFNVSIDGEIVFTGTCYDLTCRDPAGATYTTIGDSSGILSWAVYEPRKLEYVQDEETNCTTHFCDDCECSCECLCVTITEPDTTITNGEICDVSYECDPPLWEGTVGDFVLSLALGRDEYGRCIITAIVDGEEQEPVLAPGCNGMSASITLADYTLIEVVCKRCDCVGPSVCPCCPDWPLGASASIRWTSANAAANDCTGDTTPQEVTGDFGCPNAIESETIIFIVDTPLRVRIYCDEDDGGWIVEYKSAATSPWPGPGLGDESTWEWVAVEYDLACPNCDEAVDGIALGTIDFTALMRCETSGGFVDYEVIVHGDIEVVCP